MKTEFLQAKNGWGWLIGCLMVALGTPHAQAGLFYIDGHGDIAVGYEPVDPMNPMGPRQLSPHWHLGDGAGAVVLGLPLIDDQEFEPDEITAVVPLTSKFTNPGGPAWAFLGATAGSDIYFLPQNNQPSAVLPFLGIASEELNGAEWTGLSWSILVPNSAPGTFSIFKNGTFGPEVAYSSAAGPSSFATTVGSHDHFNYAFSMPGIYDLGITISGTHVVDGFKSSSATFQFFVGDVSAIPEPSSMGLLIAGAFAMAFRRRNR